MLGGLSEVAQWFIACSIYWGFICYITRRNTPYHIEQRRLKKEKRHGRISRENPAHP